LLLQKHARGRVHCRGRPVGIWSAALVLLFLL
jgi:hypothetical protein